MTIQELIDGIKAEANQHGGLKHCRNHEWRGNLNVKYNDGFLNSWRGDAVELVSWGDEALLRSALVAAFPTSEIKIANWR
jgi:hypothetical protein